MKIRIAVFAALCLFAMPVATALADTIILDNFDPDTGTRHFTVINDFDPVYNSQTALLTYQEVIAFVVGLDSSFFRAVGTDRDEGDPWRAALIQEDEWDDWVSDDSLLSASSFGSFTDVINPDPNGIQFSQAGMYFDNDGPNNNYIPPGGSGTGFFAGPGDQSFFGDFSVAPFSPSPTPAATVVRTRTISGDDGDGVFEEGETWKTESTIITVEKQSTVIPLPASALTGLGLLGLLAIRRRVRRRRL